MKYYTTYEHFHDIKINVIAENAVLAILRFISHNECSGYVIVSVRNTP